MVRVQGYELVPAISIFDLYTHALLIVVGCYVAVRFASFVWRWQIGGREADRSEAMLRHYVVTLLFRIRLRRFWFDFLQIGVLLAGLAYIIMLHRNGST